MLSLRSGYKFYFHLLGSTGCQLDVVFPRALTLSMETVQQSTLNVLLSWSQLFGLFQFFFLLSSFFFLHSDIVCYSLSSLSSFLLFLISFYFFSYLILYPSCCLLSSLFSVPCLFCSLCSPSPFRCLLFLGVPLLLPTF